MTLLLVCLFLDVVALATGVRFAWRLPVRDAKSEVASLLLFGLAVGFTFGVATMLAGFFAVLRGFTHAIFFVILPVYAVRAIRIARGMRLLSSLLLLLFVAGEACYVFATEIEPRRLEVTTAKVHSPLLASLDEPFRVALVADLQTDEIGDYEVSVFDRLVEQQPDLILFLGDYLHVSDDDVPRLRPLLHAQLARLSPPHGMFAVDGDVDGEIEELQALFEGTEVQLLIDDRTSLTGVPIDLVGLSKQKSRAPFVDAGFVRRMPKQRFPIVMGHAPDFMLSNLRGGYDPDALFVAGHTHGGQIQIPFFGPIVTLSAVPRWLAGGGVFQSGQTWLVCSRGIGMERGRAPRVRFWCRPQLIVLELSG